MDQERENFEQETEGRAKKALNAAIKALKRAIKYTVKIMLKFGWVFFIIFFLILMVYLIEYEHTGTEKEYTKEVDNEYEIDDDNVRITKENMMLPENKTIRDFYKFFAGQSFYQVNLDEYEKTQKLELKRLDDFPEDERMIDYYNREEHFLLNENVLFALDRQLYDKIRYPEQFIQPVAHKEVPKKNNPDKKEVTLDALTDEDGHVRVDSYKRNLKTGKKLRNKEKIKSIRDYGLASILFYKEDQIQYKHEGVFEAMDYWDEESKSVKTKPINEMFSVPATDYPDEDIHLIKRVVSFAGNIEYSFKTDSSPVSTVTSGSSTDIGKAVDKYEYGSYEDTSHCDPNDMDSCEPKVYPLYKYKSSSSEVVRYAPVVDDYTIDKGEYESEDEKNKQSNNDDDIDEEDEEDRRNYFNDYIWNFETYIPEDAMEYTELEKRIDYDSYVFDVTLNAEGLGIGSMINSDAYRNAYQYFDIAAMWGEEFGVDPHIIIAMIAQESGGNANSGGSDGEKGSGLMQVGNYSPNVFAYDANGNPRHFTIQPGQYTDPYYNIKWGTMLFKNKMDKFDGDPYKAIQSYNFDINIIKDWYPEDFNNGLNWLVHREEARRFHAKNEYGWADSNSISYSCFENGDELKSPGKPIYGNSCHLEMVLRFYPGDGSEAEGIPITSTPQNKPKKERKKGFKGIIESFKDAIKRIVDSASSLLKDYVDYLRLVERLDESEEDIRVVNYENHTRGDEPEIIKTYISALNNQTLYSQTDLDNFEGQSISIFDKDFAQHAGNLGNSGEIFRGELTIEEIENMAPIDGGYGAPINMAGKVVTSRFGWRGDIGVQGASKDHRGVDVGASTGTPLFATGPGRVVGRGWEGTGGWTLKIDHGNGGLSVYRHLSKFEVPMGATVEKGQLVGRVGNTGVGSGAHLHFEFRVNGMYVDPEAFLFIN